MIRSLTRPTTKSLIVPVLFFTALTALTARITIPLPFTVVPITLQTLAVLLSGLVLGSRAGALSQIAYLAAIAAGLPISASGMGGPAAFITPTAGYLIAFVPAAYVAGYLLERWQGEGRWAILLHIIAGIGGMIVIYMGGVAWLTVVLGNFQIALQQGLLPFIGVDLGKAVVAALVASGGRIIFLPATTQP
jgi:biotin transport system substrate-specific component